MFIFLGRFQKSSALKNKTKKPISCTYFLDLTCSRNTDKQSITYQRWIWTVDNRHCFESLALLCCIKVKQLREREREERSPLTNQGAGWAGSDFVPPFPQSRWEAKESKEKDRTGFQQICCFEGACFAPSVTTRI